MGVSLSVDWPTDGPVTADRIFSLWWRMLSWAFMSTLSELSERLRALDPGRLRLRTALRGVLTIGLVLLLLSGLAQRVHQPITLAFLGAAVAMVGSISINDSTRKAQQLTLFLLPIPSCLTLILGIFSAPHQLIAALVFLALGFVAVALRRFGTRGQTLGMTGLMTYFFSLFFPIGIAAIPWVLVGVAIAIGVLYLLRFWILPDRPRDLVRLSQQAFQARLGIVLGGIATELETGEDKWMNLRRQLLRLNDQALELDHFLTNEPEPGEALEVARQELVLFERELSAHRLLETAWILSKSPGPLVAQVRAEVAAQLRRIRAGLQQTRPAWQAQMQTELATLESRAGALEPIPQRALRSLCLALRRLAAGQAPPAVGAVPEAPALPEAEAEAGLNPSTRLAIQASLATAIALVLGAWIAPERWSWAAFSAFVVFLGATRGSHLLRAWHRLFGTVLGLGIGLLLAELFSQQRGLELGLIFAAIFTGIYLLRVSYAWAMTGFSIQIALLYSLLGKLDPSLLQLRLEETAIGVISAALVAAFVMPTGTRQTFYAALADCLLALGESLEHLATLPAAGPLAALERTRAFYQQAQALHALAEPLLSSQLPFRPSRIQALLHDTLALSYYLRQLALFLSRDDADDAVEQRVRADCLLLAGQARALAEAIGPRSQELNISRRVSLTALPLPMTSEPAYHWIDRLDQLLDLLAGHLGVAAGETQSAAAGLAE